MMNIIIICVLLLSPVLCFKGNHHYDKWHPEEGEEIHRRDDHLRRGGKPNIILFFCDDVSELDS